jgi:hypothetical protein
MTHYSTADTLFQGVVQGCLFGQQDRVDALNNRIQGRQFSDTELRPNFDPRPVATKYSRFSIIDPVMNRNRNLKTYNMNITLDNYKNPIFYSASTNGHVLRNIDLETNLRNQNVALQHGAPQGIYVPSSNSDLYRFEIPQSSNLGGQPFPELFDHTKLQNDTVPTITKYSSIGNMELFNHTRTQLRNTSQL